MAKFLRVTLPETPKPVSDPIRLSVLSIFGVVGAIGFSLMAIPLLDLLSIQISKLTGKPSLPQVAYPDILKVAPFLMLGAIFGGFIGNVLTNYGENLASKWNAMDLGDKINILLGTFVGIFTSVEVLNLFQNVDMAAPLRFALFLGLICALSFLVTHALFSIADYLPWTMSIAKVRKTGVKIMDTNIIIDGRIYDILKTGFLNGQLYVPGFVLEELQYIADSHDQLRRQRGRRGLEVLRHMQADFQLEVRVHDKLAPEQQDGVDGRLVRLAKAVGGDLLTNDFNLKRVAELQDVQVLSLNDLALALRPNVLPQETLPGLKIIREGNQYGQGIGYLEDGTMVVVENGQGFIGETRDVTVSQVIQTERGKMIFAQVDAETDDPRTPVRARRTTR